MIVDKKFYINAGGDGVLEDTNEDDLLGLISDLKNSEKLVIHLHGGVVSKASALATAARCLSGGTPAEDTMVDRRHPGRVLSRPQFLGRASAASATLLAGCQNPGPPGPDCDPPNVSGVDWIPDVAHPVAWGEERLTTADGAPRTLSVYYPSPRFIPRRPMLRSCLGRWPVVLFLHVQLPDGLSPAASQIE